MYEAFLSQFEIYTITVVGNEICDFMFITGNTVLDSSLLFLSVNYALVKTPLVMLSYYSFPARELETYSGLVLYPMIGVRSFIHFTAE